MIKNLVFDLGGVIINDHFADAAKIIAPKYGIDLQQLIDVYHDHNGVEYQDGTFSHEERWQKILTALNRTDINLREIMDLHESIFVPVPGMIEFVELLKDKYPIYLLSNQVEAILPHLEAKHEFFKWFKYSVFSYRVGMGKPDKDIFQYFLDKTGVKSEESLFIDNQEDNKTTAESLGFQTILFKNTEQFKQELINLNLWD